MTGFIAPDTVLGRRSFFLGRMMVSCCAADAMPVGFYCTTDKPLDIHESDWVHLTGVIDTCTMRMSWETEKRITPVLRVAEARKTGAPRRQYIYPATY